MDGHFSDSLYDRKDNRMCVPNKPLLSKNINDAARECDKLPNCTMFFSNHTNVSRQHILYCNAGNKGRVFHYDKVLWIIKSIKEIQRVVYSGVHSLYVKKRKRT